MLALALTVGTNLTLAMQHSSETAQRSDSAYEASLAPSGREAVIIGGGVAGLLAAHVACKHGFNRVTLLDRDLLGGDVQQETVQEVSLGVLPCQPRTSLAMEMQTSQVLIRLGVGMLAPAQQQ